MANFLFWCIPTKDMATAVLGGTFNFIHGGHRSLFEEAFRFDNVLIGLTTDEFVRKRKIYPQLPFERRKKQLTAFLQRIGKGKEWSIFPLNDEFGAAVENEGIDAIIVSEETAPVAKEINRRRKRRKMKELGVIVLPIVYGEDYKRISCARVYEKIIDEEGKRLKPIRIFIGSRNPEKAKGAREGAVKVFGKNVEVKTVPISSRVSEQPFGEETIRGAVNRARDAFEKGCDYGIGFESGIFKFKGRFFDILWCAICDEEGITFGSSMGFEVGSGIVAEMKKGKTLSDVSYDIFGIKDIGKKKGVIYYLSRGKLERRSMVEQAFMCAMIPRTTRLECLCRG